tara:strand:- start:29 stop:220 length:192 start_codon:yes stop_codon:yes gene_type:complete
MLQVWWILEALVWSDLVWIIAVETTLLRWLLDGQHNKQVSLSRNARNTDTANSKTWRLNTKTR